MDAITKRLAEINARRAAINGLVENATTEELEGLETEVRGLNEEALQLRRKSLIGQTGEGIEIQFAPEERKPADEDEDPEDFYGSLEYRKSFRKYITTHDRSVLKQRADAVTTVADIAAVVPTTVMAMIVKEMKDYGSIFSQVSVTNFKGGLEIPLGGVKPVASWVAEGATAEKSEYKADTKLSFSYHKLQIKIASTLMASVVSLDIWESQVAELIGEAMVVKIEEAIFNGTGIGQPTGITADARLTNSNVFGAADATWTGWKTKFFSKIPLVIRKAKRGKIYVNPLTWDKYMDGMVDSNGQPVARNYFGIDGESKHRFMGKEVELTDLLPSLDDAAADTIFLVFGNLKDYGFNSNMSITQRNYIDETTDENVEKSTMICDGKIINPQGFVALKTAA